MTGIGIDPQLLVPYPDELVRPVGAYEDWRPVTVEELGWRVLPADATPAQRARAESVWQPVTAVRPCRCSGPCMHGELCDDGEDGDGVRSCPGQRVHYDRCAGSLFRLDGWYDFYACDTCGASYEYCVDLPDVPWGEAIPGGFRQFEGVRRVTFHDEEGSETCRDPGVEACRDPDCDVCFYPTDREPRS
jgi:hypothetical protein